VKNELQAVEGGKCGLINLLKPTGYVMHEQV